MGINAFETVIVPMLEALGVGAALGTVGLGALRALGSILGDHEQ